MPTHNIRALDRNAAALIRILKKFGDTKDIEDLRAKIFPRPGWTTPAEFFLVDNSITALRTQLEAIQGLRNAVVRGSKMIGG